MPSVRHISRCLYTVLFCCSMHQHQCVVQAVLIEHDKVVLSDLSAVVVSGGHKGENLIKDYDQVFPMCCS